MSIAIYTTIFGDYSPLRPVPAQSVKADYYCITDNPKIKCEGWKTIVVNTPRADLHPRMRAKFYKLFPWELPELDKKEISIFIDASIEITEPNFIEYCIKNLDGDMLLFKHPNRDCIYEEAKASVGLVKYKTENISGQIDFYQKFHPKKSGLYACGLMIRKHTEKVKTVMSAWWWENIKFTYQDQLSFPVVCRLHNFKPSTFAENQYKSGYFKVHWHDDEPQKETARPLIPLKPDPTVSVLMSLYNTPVNEAKQAIDSILNQTYNKFQFVIVNDNSTDENFLEYYYMLRDPRIKKVETTENKGLANALNIGLSNCTGDIIVRMDGDDIADCNLIMYHVKFFIEHPEAVVHGVQIEAFGERSFRSNHPKVIDKNYAFRNQDKKYWFINHPGVAYKKNVVESVGGYGDTPINLPEDYYLWCKLLKAGYVINNTSEVLMKYRVKRKPERSQIEWIEYLENNRKQLL
jgi:GT2 family glycosyltransferase